MLKHTGDVFLQTITILLNRCLTSQLIPKQWKEGYIFPISKKPVFDGNLHNTRPISLIEHIKKLYTKILTNRLSISLMSKQILSPLNYVALPGNSTSTPIHILNNIIEDSYCNNKELWLLFQDMSKAYNSVNTNLLQKSLERIQLPPQLTQIILNLLSDCSNKVITNFGLTQSYSVKNGIDQGETITPLLWHIYYDPLISQISKKYKGYNLGVSWITDLKLKQTQQLQISTSVLAFMDDTLWIAPSKNELEQILTLASSFFTIANIQVNPLKSILSTNSKNPTPINFIQQTITPQPKNTPFKFLGCWFLPNYQQT